MSDLFDLPFEEDDADADGVAGKGGPATPSGGAPQRDPASEAGSRGAIQPSGASAPAPIERRILTVTELTVRVRDLLETAFLEVWVEGELSNCRVWNTGHLYFTLKDSATQIRAVIFRSALRYLKFKPADGLRVVARGRLSVYEPKGEYQLVCEHLEPQGLGALQLAFDQLKQRLQREGLFDQARKRPLPSLPRKIGVVTSLDGAAIHDIVKVLRRRYVNAHVIIRPTRVQGEGAAGEVARGLRAIGRVPGVDVVIVGRGGGSIEDLWAFNEEVVARAIALSPIPVISAVGHESDITIADLVADLRAPTPSAAAELVVAAKDDFCSRIDRLEDRLRAATYSRIQGLSRRVHAIAGRPALSGYPGRVAMRGRHAAELAHAASRLVGSAIVARDRRLQQLERQLATFDVGRRLAAIRTRLVGADGRLRSAMSRRQHRVTAHLSNRVGRLESLSPLAVLARGYAVCWTGDRTRLVRTTSDVGVGDRVRVTLANGELGCEVRAIEKPPTDERSDL
jgi:exodeoxyribonuclease VII large subunit